MDYHFFVIALILNVQIISSDDASGFVTQTVYGFLDFTTTIGNTVMVFSPQSAPTLGKIDIPLNIIETKPINSNLHGFENGIKPTKLISTEKTSPSKSITESIKNLKSSSSPESNHNNDSTSKYTKTVNSYYDVGNEQSTVHVENNLKQFEYDLLSRQPAEYAEETYRVVNLKSRSHDNNKARSNSRRKQGTSATSNHPIGVVTKLSGVELKDGITTIHETSVVGTYISGKYAQILQSSSNIHKNKKNKIRPTTSVRILKTADSKSNHNAQITNRHSISNRLHNKNLSSTTKESTVLGEHTLQTADHRNTKKSQSRKSKRKHKDSRSSSDHKGTPLATVSSSEVGGRRSFRSKIQPSISETDTSTSLYMFKLNRTPGRWQYKSSPKPRVTIRKVSNENTVSNGPTKNTSLSIMDQITNDQTIPNSILEQGDLESSGSQNGAVLNNLVQENNQKPFVETLNVEISTPANFKDTYYEIATIKTPYAFQAGVVKKTRYITVTSTIEKILKPETTSAIPKNVPLTENILASSSDMVRGIHLLEDGSIRTLNTIHLTNDEETPSLETITESFSITQTKLRTHLLPIVNDKANHTTHLTLVQTYDFTSLITVTKTISPLEDNDFIPSQSFKDFGGNLDEAGSEINLELEFGDSDNLEDIGDVKIKNNDFDISFNTNQSSLIPSAIIQNTLPLQTLHLPQLSTVITNTHPVVKLETLWTSNVLPIVNGLSTTYRTLSKSIVVEKTEYKLDSTTLALPSAPPPVSINPYLLQVPQFQTITSSVVQQAVVTQTNSKILKLTFGAKTAYTTIFSTEVVPTTLVMYITTSLPVQPSANFPGYFPPPYPPYAYLG